MRIAVKLGYIGEGFHGYQRQVREPTIEGLLVQALTEAKLIRNPRLSRFSSAARTDRGVSALGQVVAFDVELPAKAVCERLARHLPWKIFPWAWAEVNDNFSPRRDALLKTYTYLLFPDLPHLPKYASVFEGTHDFSQFCRPSERNTIREVKIVAVEEGTPNVITFKARGFLWAQIRKMVSAMELMATGELDPGVVSAALRGEATLSLTPAPARNLILQEIEYDGVDFCVSVHCKERAAGSLQKSLARLEESVQVNRRLLVGLLGNAPST